jgi:cytochrome c-type biogenesis protein CcmH
MILWIVLTIMTAVAAVVAATPFIRRAERRRADAALDVAVFKDQLKEVDAEAAQGLIEPAQADAARSEIKRRLLAAARDDDASAPGLSGGERAFAAVGVAVVIVGGAIGLYALTGKFESRGDNEWPAEAAAETEAPPAPAIAEAKPAPRASIGEPIGRGGARPDSGAAKALPSVDDMIQRIVKRLDANPKDASGWRMLGWSYGGVERYAEAADAYAKAIALAPAVADLKSARAEMLIRGAAGAVTAEAKTLIDEALALDPKEPRARYFKGLAKEQDGDPAGAIADWKRIAAEGDPNDAFILELSQKLAGLENPGAAPAAPATAPAPAQAAPPERGPTAQDVKRAEAMTPDDRATMIRQMVDALAARLEKSPHDADGWIKLIRSRTVLRDQDKAREALGLALKTFDGEPDERARIAGVGKDLGLTP